MGLVTSAFLFSGFLSVASLLLVLSRPCEAQIHSPGAGLWTGARAIGAPSTFGGVPSPRHPSSGLAPSPPRRPRLRPLHQSRADAVEGQGFGRARSTPLPPPHPLAGRAQGSPSPGRSEDKLKGDGGFWERVPRQERQATPGELGSTQRTRVPGPQVRLPPRGLGQRRPVYTARAPPGTARRSGPGACGRRAPGARGAALLHRQGRSPRPQPQQVGARRVGGGAGSGRSRG